jgi:glycerol-3-phosphate dehydrogenase
MLEKIEEHLGKRGKPWTADSTLPGGDFPVNGYDAEVSKLMSEYSFLDLPHARRLIRLYGTRARVLLGAARSEKELGENFGADLFEAEVRYLMEHEWAVTAADVLWRRTKRGLRLSKEQAGSLERYMANADGDRAAAE